MDFYKKVEKIIQINTELKCKQYLRNAVWYLDILYAFLYGLKANCTADLTLHTN